MAQTGHLGNDNISRYKFFFLDTYILDTIFCSHVLRIKGISIFFFFFANQTLLIKHRKM